ncbi:DUF1127 domain-containing protein [Yoonia vestfoldensis]|uniref:DUF1127 domain-containing protein n=1 Tax=Yoonia vestfoldensis TaxID=245188 RepID=A0A1Y0EAW5_9RHOB|nr:DUF1127 domain-containing protein [Yoonia vestfoldensis]ARU00765.1 hypothetical protein LOKVESSMR4R_01448 [Yoonia vestfoldensis]
MFIAIQPQQVAALARQSHLPIMAGLALRFAVIVTTWDQRRRTRKHLRNLPLHLLDDIGLDYPAALAEMSKPFWRA